MISIQELLPHIELLESDERLAVGSPTRPFSVVAVGAFLREEDARCIPFARLFRVAWISMTCAERTQAVFGSETIIVGPGEDLQTAQVAFSLARAGELVEAHPPGTLALIAGPLTPLDAASDEFANVLLEALGRARSAGSTLLGYFPHPSPALFEGWLNQGERSPWSRSGGLFWCYVNVGDAIIRLEAYEIAPGQHDRVAAIAVAHLQKAFPHPPRPT